MLPPRTTIRFGLHANQESATFDEYLRLWLKAEDLGLDWASCMDHFQAVHGNPSAPSFEGLTTLSALAARTSRIRCGILAIGVTYRNPALLAKMASTIDHISSGRLELCLGAGWHEMEHREYGIPFPRAAERIAMLGEAAAMIRSLWTQPRTTFHGRYYTVDDALCEPKPVQQPHIPLWIGGAGEKLTLRVVAERADGWHSPCGPVAEYAHRVDALERHCRDLGRDPRAIRRAINFEPIVGDSPAECRERHRRLAAMAGVDEAAFGRCAVTGSPEQCAAQLLEYVKLGVSDLFMNLHPPGDDRALELVAAKIAPIVKAEGARILAAQA